MFSEVIIQIRLMYILSKHKADFAQNVKVCAKFQLNGLDSRKFFEILISSTTTLIYCLPTYQVEIIF